MNERVATASECFFIANRFGNQIYADAKLLSFVLDIESLTSYKVDFLDYVQTEIPATISLGKYLMDAKLTVGEMKKLLLNYRWDLLSEFETLCEVTQEEKL